MANPARGGCRRTGGGASQVTVSGPRRARRPCSAQGLERAAVGDPPELGARGSHRRTLQGGGHPRARPARSGRQPLAALEPPSLDHRAAGAVGHPMAEAVALGAAAVVRLVGALHGGCLLGSQGHGGPAPGIGSEIAGASRRAGAQRRRGASGTLEVRAPWGQPGGSRSRSLPHPQARDRDHPCPLTRGDERNPQDPLRRPGTPVLRSPNPAAAVWGGGSSGSDLRGRAHRGGGWPARRRATAPLPGLFHNCGRPVDVPHQEERAE